MTHSAARTDSRKTVPLPQCPVVGRGRRRLPERCRNRPISHAAAEMGISRACTGQWVDRYRRFRELGLLAGTR
uniref:helix-turn-helix domain-containing protein n=1 Tax=Microtetraspora fusca TaxID=1997 RepID=UPI0035709963